MQAVESLKICTLIRSFCPKHIKFRWKNTEELCFLALKSDAKLKEKLTLGSKNDMRNLVNFHPTTQKSKNFTLMGYFCPKYMRFELKKYRGVIFHDTEQWCKIWINPDLVVSKMAWKIGWTFIRAPKSLEIVHWWALFVQSIHCFSNKISEELLSWHWRMLQSLNENWLVAWKMT